MDKFAMVAQCLGNRAETLSPGPVISLELCVSGSLLISLKTEVGC